MNKSMKKKENKYTGQATWRDKATTEHRIKSYAQREAERRARVYALTIFILTIVIIILLLTR